MPWEVREIHRQTCEICGWTFCKKVKNDRGKKRRVCNVLALMLLKTTSNRRYLQQLAHVLFFHFFFFIWRCMEWVGDWNWLGVISYDRHDTLAHQAQKFVRARTGALHLTFRPPGRISYRQSNPTVVRRRATFIFFCSPCKVYQTDVECVSIAIQYHVVETGIYTT